MNDAISSYSGSVSKTTWGETDEMQHVLSDTAPDSLSPP